MGENNLIKCYPALEKKDEVIEIFNTIVPGIKDVDITEDLAEVVYIPEFNGKSKNRGVFLRENYNYVMQNRIQDGDTDKDRIHEELQKYGYINILAYIWSVGVKYHLDLEMLTSELLAILQNLPFNNGAYNGIDEEQDDNEAEQKLSAGIGYRYESYGYEFVHLNYFNTEKATGKIKILYKDYCKRIENKLNEKNTSRFDHSKGIFWSFMKTEFEFASCERTQKNGKEVLTDYGKAMAEIRHRKEISKDNRQIEVENNAPYEEKGYVQTEHQFDLDKGEITYIVLYFYILSKICMVSDLEVYKRLEDDKSIQEFFKKVWLAEGPNGKNTKCVRVFPVKNNEKAKNRAKYFKAIFTYDRLVNNYFEDECTKMHNIYKKCIYGLLVDNVTYFLKGIVKGSGNSDVTETDNMEKFLNRKVVYTDESKTDNLKEARDVVIEYTNIPEVFNTSMLTNEEIRDRARVKARKLELAENDLPKGINIDKIVIKKGRGRIALGCCMDQEKIIEVDTVTDWTTKYDKWVGKMYEISIGDIGRYKKRKTVSETNAPKYNERYKSYEEKARNCYISQICKGLKDILKKNHRLLVC